MTAGEGNVAYSRTVKQGRVGVLWTYICRQYLPKIEDDSLRPMRRGANQFVLTC